MPTLTELETEELVLPQGPPSRVYRMVERLADNHWAVAGWSAHFSTGLDALLAIREEVARTSTYPVRIHIKWRGLPSGTPAPSTGTSL